MMPRSLPLLTLALSLAVSAPVHAAQAAQTQVQAELAKLAPALAGPAKAILAETDERKRAKLAGALAKADPAAVTEFLLAVLSAEQSVTVRLSIVESLGKNSTPRIRRELAGLAASDSDVRVSLSALECLRVQQAQDGRDLLVKRLELARRTHDEAALARLAAEQERWISLVRGTMLPSFMRIPPPRFSIKPDQQPVRVLAFGDSGTGSPDQKQTAAAMADWNRKAAFDFAITLGDNFYNAGMASPTDTRWKKLWDELYDPLRIKFYASLGNHDWGLNDSPAAEILYSERSPSWRMPSPYYTFSAGPAQFFALDTSEVSEAQLMWLDAELKKSTAKWRLAYGHHPIYSDGPHGDSPLLIEKLLPLLKNRVDVYLAGHDHIFNHIRPDAGVQFFVSGGGGAPVYSVKPGPRTMFAQSTHGFTILEIDADEVRARFIGADSKQLYTYSIRK
jgi:tartrate-resistant acid phosphatase type 5